MATDVSPAMQALYEGDRARAEAALPPDDELDVFHAAAFARTERMRQILAGDPAASGAWSPDGFTALHLAAFSDADEAARLLVEAGADLEARSRHETIIGVRPLNTCAFAHAQGVARVLLEAGADPNGEGEQGFTPLMAARAQGDEELASLLLEHGAEEGPPPSSDTET
jgi:ankyrin repeat protein